MWAVLALAAVIFFSDVMSGWNRANSWSVSTASMVEEVQKTLPRKVDDDTQWVAFKAGKDKEFIFRYVVANMPSEALNSPVIMEKTKESMRNVVTEGLNATDSPFIRWVRDQQLMLHYCAEDPTGRLMFEFTIQLPKR